MAPEHINTVQDALAFAEDAFAAIGPLVWWRGHGDATWRLVPGVHRVTGSFRHEQHLARVFAQRARSRRERCPPLDDIPAWLFLMQHYRAPTRLLDWTESELVALYFAASEERTKDGALFALGPMRCNEAQGQGYFVLSPGSAQVTPLFTPIVSNDDIPPTELALAIIADEVDLRMLVQLAAFTLHGSAVPLDAHAQFAAFARRAIVPSNKKPALLRQLSMLGVRPSTLFPDLEHLALELRDMRWTPPPKPAAPSGAS